MKKMLLIALAICLMGGLLLSSPKEALAASPYITRTLNRYGELVETQDAYEAILKLRTFGIAGVLDNPKDLFIDSDDYLFIADTGNKRIVVLDEAFEVISVFGEDRLIKPTGIFVRDGYVYIADYGTPENVDSGRIFVYEFDKSKIGFEEPVRYVKEFARPVSPIFSIDGFVFRPEKIAVDSNHTMYIVVEGSSNGLLLVSSENRFLNYFAPNQVEGTIRDQVIRLLYGNNEDARIVKKIPPAPSNVALDDSGYIYTVTQTIVRNAIGDTLKKVNIGGTNFFPVDMRTTGDFVDASAGTVQNMVAVTKSGFIYEYDQLGNLLFVFAGRGLGNERLGLFNSASAIVVASNGHLIVADDNAGNLQVFRKTNFATYVHSALDLYQNGRYVESKALWEEVLRYNSMFDMAHKGIGLAYYMETNYTAALDKFEIANAKPEYSDAFWEIRNLWLVDHFASVMMGIVLGSLAIFLLQKTNQKYHYLAFVGRTFQQWKEKPVCSEMLFMFRFLRNPADACYKVRRENRVHWPTGVIYLVLLFVWYVLGLLFTGFLFNPVVLERTILFKEALKIVIPILSFVLANHLVSSLMEGEGTFKAVFIATFGALMPVVLIYPLLIVVSNVITYNESFLFSFGMAIMVGWSAVMVFVVTKETHNFTLRQTFFNLFLTVLMMIVLIVIVVMGIVMIAQVANFAIDVIKEVVIRG